MSAPTDSIVAICGSCGQKNRVARTRDLDAAVCGRCRANLRLASVSPVTDATFARDVLRSPLPVVVDCWAEWCGPCRAVAPVVDDLAQKLAGRVRFMKINVDDNPITSSDYGIMSIPTLLLIRDGAVVARIVGAQPAEAIIVELKRHGFA